MEMWGMGEGLNRIGVYLDIVDSLYNVVEVCVRFVCSLWDLITCAWILWMHVRDDYVY